MKREYRAETDRERKKAKLEIVSADCPTLSWSTLLVPLMIMVMKWTSTCSFANLSIGYNWVKIQFACRKRADFLLFYLSKCYEFIMSYELTRMNGNRDLKKSNAFMRKLVLAHHLNVEYMQNAHCCHYYDLTWCPDKIDLHKIRLQ